MAEQMFAAAWHDTGVVAEQDRIVGGDATGALAPLVERLHTRGELGPDVCVTVDDKHAQRSMADAVRDTSTHFLVTIKDNQPTLRTQIAALDWDAVRAYATRDRAPGRVEERTVRTVTLGVHLHGCGWRDVAQVGQVTRRTLRKKTPTAEPSWTQETVHIMTSLPAGRAGIATIGDLVRMHWASRTVSTTCATWPWVRTTTRRALGTRPRSGPACATSSWASYAKAAPRTSPQHKRPRTGIPRSSSPSSRHSASQVTTRKRTPSPWG
ncbi:hypothetical protein [Xylanimonas ulmi]|uniref:hypothetical protein n=1 Tax=Xylanimonas ulmi TaxID=228973 RepID=UPI00102CB52C|nr:hypothetical protein [Xylanibacterium ulmi]